MCFTVKSCLQCLREGEIDVLLDIEVGRYYFRPWGVGRAIAVSRL